MELFTDLLGSIIDLFSSSEFTDLLESLTDLLGTLILSDVKVVRIGATDRGRARRTKVERTTDQGRASQRGRPRSCESEMADRGRANDGPRSCESEMANRGRADDGQRSCESKMVNRGRSNGGQRSYKAENGARPPSSHRGRARQKMTPDLRVRTEVVRGGK